VSQAHHEVLINRPIDEVFDFLAGGVNNPRWQPLVVSTTPPSGDIEVGSTFRQRVRHPLGFRVSADYRVTAYERPRRLAVEVISGGPIRPTVAYDLVPGGDGVGATSLRCTIEHHPTGLARFASPTLALLHPLFAWEASAVERARRLLEAPGPAEA
jgi:uncharacterized protein YndB with AHSA1/START domain